MQLELSIKLMEINLMCKLELNNLNYIFHKLIDNIVVLMLDTNAVTFSNCIDNIVDGCLT